jgi:citrate synthase
MSGARPAPPPDRPASAWATGITEVAPNAIRVRGYGVEELMGRVSFARVVYLVLRGELPGEAVGRVLDAALVACVDHGATPPSTLAARTSASTGAPLNAALAVGLLSINEHHGGAIEGCMRVFDAASRAQVKRGLSAETAAQEAVDEHRAAGRRVPGFGHRLHTEDPRSRRLLALADEADVAGSAVALGRAVERALEATSGRRLPLNVDGAIAAVLCDLGFEPELANAFFILARLPGLAAHVLEERARERPVRRVHPTDHRYDGPPARSLP